MAMNNWNCNSHSNQVLIKNLFLAVQDGAEISNNVRIRCTRTESLNLACE